MSSPAPFLGPEGLANTQEGIGAGTNRTRQYLPALDGVRAIAATAVLLTHVGFATGAVQPSLLGALTARLDIGVALFFALSGFLMLKPWFHVALDDAGTVRSTARYALLRVGRILPAYWVVTAVVLMAEANRWFGPDLRSSLPIDPHVVLSHLVVAQGLTGEYFSAFSQSWSLTTEVCFYIAVPVVGSLIVRRGRRAHDHARRVQLLERWCMATIAVGVGVATFSASGLPGASPTLATSLLGHCAWFAAGALVCVRSHRPQPTRARPGTADRRLLMALALLVLAASPLGGNLLFEQPAPWQAGIRELLYTFIAVLVMSTATTTSMSDDSVAVRVLSGRTLAWLGTRSYALFLWHLPILFGLLTVFRLDLFEGSFPLVAFATFAVSLAVADLSWRFIEHPTLVRVQHIVQARRHQ